MLIIIFFFFNDTATTEIYTLSLHDALPICLVLGFIDLCRFLGHQGSPKCDASAHGITPSCSACRVCSAWCAYTPRCGSTPRPFARRMLPPARRHLQCRAGVVQRVLGIVDRG